ncbi:T9SS type A sorting domain-containing protein [Pedobacter insulae]|uniref:Por secretion system C-terminal sorting domain-containing protein n=1 Tax=Pedobacter insulae TaxID=414048 RepID=A0A1I2XVX4_9SPHI|nr:T9SS type A sorting domain-containing protein [Pedobacter insulae]SFH17512.1 Por secretion system C-terminal sorting domain-containing protein [Pedobacter insulae]
MGKKSIIGLFWSFLCIICIGFASNSAVFAQKTDSSKISIKPKPRVVSRLPVIRGSVQAYKPGNISFNTTSSTSTQSVNASNVKSGKILTILKLYPNPVSEYLNINMRLEKDANLSVKITDLLGNDIISLMNDRGMAGEQTKTFTIPNKLNPGIYFVKVNAGGDLKVLKISVL